MNFISLSVWGKRKRGQYKPVQFCKMEQDEYQKTASLVLLYSQVLPRAKKCRKLFAKSTKVKRYIKKIKKKCSDIK